MALGLNREATVNFIKPRVKIEIMHQQHQLNPHDARTGLQARQTASATRGCSQSCGKNN